MGCFSILIQQRKNFPFALRHKLRIIFLTVGFLNPGSGILLLIRAKPLSCVVKFHRVKVCRLRLQLGVLFEGGIQFGWYCFSQPSACIALNSAAVKPRSSPFLMHRYSFSVLWHCLPPLEKRPVDASGRAHGPTNGRDTPLAKPVVSKCALREKEEGRPGFPERPIL